MIRRIAYANDDWTRTADVVPLPTGKGWRVWLGNLAESEHSHRDARTMTQCQAWARQWVRENAGRRDAQ